MYRLLKRAALRWTGLILVCVALLLPLAGSHASWQVVPDVTIPESYRLAAENDLFQLYVDETTLAFKLVDRRSGYLWHSGLDEVLEDDDLNRSWQAYAISGLSIEYLDSRGVNRRASITNSEHTLSVAETENGISATVTFTEYGITVGLRVQLEADGMRVAVPFDSIREEDATFRLGRLYVYPFMGAVRGSSVPGYMMMPDGTGSLIRFADTTRADNMFIGRYYGDDLGIISQQPWDPFISQPAPISMPLFGIAHTDAQSAFISVVESGASYGELHVHPSHVITNFNFLHHAFVYNQPYFQATNRSGAGVTTVQQQPNTFDVVIRYRFLTGDEANYVGMAHSYREYLLERGILRQEETAGADIPVRLEFLGGDKEDVLLWDRFIPMTTVSQMSDILEALQLPNAEVIYYGWQPFGATSVAPTWLALEGGLGSAADLNALAERLSANGGNLSLYYDPQAALRNEPGYSARTDLAMSITNQQIRGYARYFSHYFTLEVLRSRFEALAADMPVQLATGGLALDSIGYTLYSDFRDETPITREQSISAYRALLADMPLRLGVYRPNDYLLSAASAYYDMPLRNNGYIYATDSVPFLPIVLSGHMPYFGSALNFSSNQQEDVLRHVEYGIYPSYFLTQEPTANMINSPSNWIYTSSFAQWNDHIQETYARINALLGPVRGQEIVAHEILAPGVHATTYAGGAQIIVNYSNTAFSEEGITVEARDALLVENN